MKTHQDAIGIFELERRMTELEEAEETAKRPTDAPWQK
jgi:hypothetical protein